jgi:Concanavalin A-like lectin/glucanases superfamily
MSPPHCHTIFCYPLLLTITALFAAAPSRADITVLHHWMLGEGDGPEPSTITKDSVGTLDLTLTGTTSRVTSTVPTSTMAMQVTNTWGPWPTPAQSFVTDTATPVVLPDPANWGFECWAWMDSIPGAGQDSECTFVHIGDHTPGSEVMELISGNYIIHLPGVALADSGIAASADIGKWVHLAMVNEEEYTIDNGQDPPVITPTGGRRVRMFRDGVEIVATNGTPNGGPGIVTIGSQKLSGIGGLEHSRGLNGKIDDVRIFSFALGSFNPATDLLYPDGPGSTAPFEITSMSIAVNGDVTLTWNSQPGESYSVRESTDLGTWLEITDGVASQGAETSTTITPLHTNATRLFLKVQTP